MQHPNITEVILYGDLRPSVPIERCELCNDPIYTGYEFYCFDDGTITCADCKSDYIFELEQKAVGTAGEWR